MRIKKKQITVLGGSGYIGSHLCDLLTQKGYHVNIFDIKRRIPIKKNQKMYLGNLLQKNKLNNAIKKSNYVYNFAALSNIDYASSKPFKSALINILGTINVLEICKKNNVKKLIHASSIYANSEQGGFYGCSKKASEDYIERFNDKFNLKFTILRFGSLYGGRASSDNGLQKLIDIAKKKNKIIYSGTSRAARRYIYIDDACSACLESIKKKYDNKYLTVTGNHKIKIIKVIEIIKKTLKIQSNKIKFLNTKDNTHYINEPKIYKPRAGAILNIKSKVNFRKKIKELLIK